MIRIAGNAIDALKAHPLALMLVILNALFVVVGAYGFREISASAARRDALLTQLIADDCKAARKGDRQ